MANGNRLLKIASWGIKTIKMYGGRSGAGRIKSSRKTTAPGSTGQLTRYVLSIIDTSIL